MPKAVYTEGQKVAWVEYAQNHGLAKAMNDLGYPGSKGTASRWLNFYGTRPTVDALRQYAAEHKTFYSHQEKMALADELLLAIHNRLNPPMVEVFIDPNQPELGTRQEPAWYVDGSEVRGLSTAYKQTVQTIELLEGRPTNIEEHSLTDPTDIELRKLVTDMRERNEKALAKARA